MLQLGYSQAADAVVFIIVIIRHKWIKAILIFLPFAGAWLNFYYLTVARRRREIKLFFVD